MVAGAAWAAPALVVATAAPAIAASAPILFAHRTRFQWYSNNAPWCTSGRDGIEIGTTTATTGVTFTGTTGTTKISTVYAYFWFTRSDIAFVSATGNSGCWTKPTADGTTATSGGRTYYRYLTTYTCPIAAAAGLTTLQPYRWQSQCYNVADTTWANAQWARRQAYATVNGTVQSTDTGYFQILTTP